MGKSKYRYCKLDGKEFHGSDREKHMKDTHGIEMNLKKPSEWFLEGISQLNEQIAKDRTEDAQIVGKSDYVCAICKKSLDSDTIHNHYVEELTRAFEAQGCKVIIEGKTTEWATPRGWGEPDLFVLKDLNLVKVIEVIVSDSYEKTGTSVYMKSKKIRNYYDPPEVIVFQPTDFLDKKYLQTQKGYYKREFQLDEEPTSFKDIDRLYAEKWKKKGLNVVFWNEEKLKQLWKGNIK